MMSSSIKDLNVTVGVAIPPPRPCNTPLERSNTVTSCPALDIKMAAEQPAIDPPTIPTFNDFDIFPPVVRIYFEYANGK